MAGKGRGCVLVASCHVRGRHRPVVVYKHLAMERNAENSCGGSLCIIHTQLLLILYPGKLIFLLALYFGGTKYTHIVQRSFKLFRIWIFSFLFKV